MYGRSRRNARGRRWWLASLVAFVLAPAACNRSEALAELDTPIKAKLSHEAHSTVGGSGNHFVCNPQRITSETLELSVDKLRAQLPEAPGSGRPARLVSDERGARLAYRLGDAPWRVVYVGRKHLLISPDSLLIRAPEVDFAKVASLEGAAPAIYRESVIQRDAVVDEIRSLGKEPLTALLTATLDADAAPGDLWEKSFKELDAPAQARVATALRSAVREQAPRSVLLRMARVAPIDAPPLAAAALSAAEALEPRDKNGVPSVILAQAALVDAALAARRGCSWLSDARRKEDQLAALLALGADKAPCPGLAAALTALDPCARELRCGDPIRHDSPLCSAEAAGERIQRSLRKLASWVDLDPTSLEAARAFTALARGAIDERMQLANSRRAYKPVATGESCEIAERAAEPCRCDTTALLEAACRTQESSGAVENCAFEIDDAARAIKNVRSQYQARATTVFAGSDLGCAILIGDGSIECWGEGMSSMPGTDANRKPSAALTGSAPWIRSAQRRRIPGIKRAIAGAAGRGSACAIVEGGDVYCWGALNSGDKAAHKVLADAVAVGVGDSHACAVLSTGEAQCWGHNSAGQLGIGARELDYTNDPVRVAGVTSAESLACAQFQCCARTRDRRLACWGGHANAPDAKFLEAELVEGAVEVRNYGVWAFGGCAALKFGGIACWRQEPHPRATRAIEAVESAVSLGVLEKGIVALVDGKATFHPRTGPALPMPLDQPIGALAVSYATVLPQVYALGDDGRIARLPLPAAAH